MVGSVLIKPMPAENDVKSAAVASRVLARVRTLPSVASCMLNFFAAASYDSSSRLSDAVGSVTTASL